jgi:hypothetical protein
MRLYADKRGTFRRRRAHCTAMSAMQIGKTLGSSLHAILPYLLVLEQTYVMHRTLMSDMHHVLRRFVVSF